MTISEKKIHLSDWIAPCFQGLYQDIKEEKHAHYWLQGGRGSGKSSFISLQMVLGIMRDPMANGAVIRKVGRTLKDSVFTQILWAIELLGAEDCWNARYSSLELCYLPTGGRILFRGADDPRKLKSTKVARGYIRYVWYEEADEFHSMEELRSMNQSLLRGGTKGQVFYSYNPPKNRRCWINREVERLPLFSGGGERGRAVRHRSDYRDLPEKWLGKSFLEEAEALRRDKPEKYEQEYLGKAGSNENAVFGNLTLREISEAEIARFSKIRRGIDWGFASDPFVYLVLALEGDRVILFREFYQTGATYQQIADVILAENHDRECVTADSAEPRSNEELRSRGIPVFAARKGPGSISHGINWLRERREIVIDPQRCPNAAREFYEYERDTEGRKGEFPDRNNHTIDACRYALEEDMRGGGWFD